MSNYVQTTFFTPKDSLPTTNPAKTIFGAAYDVEFNNIAVAVATKFDSSTISSVPLAFNLGSAAAPGVTFVGELGTGLYSNGSGDLGHATGGIARLTISGTTGGTSILQPTSGVALAVANTGASPSTAAIALTVGSAGVAQTFSDGTNTGGYIGFGGSHDTQFGTSTAQAVTFVTNNSSRLSISSVGAVSIPAPTSGVGLTVFGIANSFTGNLAGSGTAGQSFGLRIAAGTNSSDEALLIVNASGASTLLTIFGDGGVTVGSPTGGDKGLGTLNATGVFVNGAAILTASTGTFTGTLTGFTAGTSGTINYVVAGGICALYAPAGFTGTSNAITMTMTGLPSAVQPANTVNATCGKVSNNNGIDYACECTVSGSTITFTTLLGSSPNITYGGSFANTGVKGLGTGWTITYPIS